MHFISPLLPLFSLLTLSSALTLPLSSPVSALSALIPRAGKPTGGPASATIKIYSGPYTCSSVSSVPPIDGTAGTASSTVNIAETQCAIVNIPFGGVITAAMTAAPKTGTTGCYVQIYMQSGCGVVLENEYHGFAFDGVVVGSKVGCVTPPVRSYGAVEIVCA